MYYFSKNVCLSCNQRCNPKHYSFEQHPQRPSGKISFPSSHRACWGLRSSVTLSRPCLHWPSWSSSYRARRELKSSVTLSCPCSHWPSCCSSHSARIIKLSVTLSRITAIHPTVPTERVQELCESRGGRPGLSFLTSLMVFVDVKQYWTMLRH